MLTLFAGLFWFGLIGFLIVVGVCCAVQSFCDWVREKFRK